MIEDIKIKLWDLLKEKEVSLAMIYNREGEILWHTGRNIKGKTIHEGEGFSKSYLKKAIENLKTVEEENVYILSRSEGLPKSAFNLNLKSVYIQPVNDEFFLYIDSGIKESFSSADRQIFTFMGEMLGNVIKKIRTREAEGITGTSETIKNIRELVLKYSLEDQPVLLLGESGVGKSYIAELIHQYSGRNGKFVTVNTPSIPEHLFESTLFGHKKGAFTDAKIDKKGFVDEANGGTLFFDEISEVPLHFQAKLLRFIDTRMYTVLGETSEQKADVRILAATNKDLNEAINQKEFREDLYYRLQVLEIEIPPLRDRKDDLKALVLENLTLLKGKEMGQGFWDAINKHNWPGNVRELITVLTRAGILVDSPIERKDVEAIICQSQYKKSMDQKNSRVEQVWEELMAGRSFWDVVKKPYLNRDLNRNEVKEIISRALHRGERYKDILNDLNIKEKDYKKFLNFLNFNQCKP